MAISRENIQNARVADLYGYLYAHHLDEVIIEGNSLKLATNPSISVKKGYTGYKDFANDDDGNSIDFLVKNLGYPFTEAVNALNSFTASVPRPVASLPLKEFTLPPDSGSFAAAEKYLLARGICSSLLDILRKNHLVYQDFRNNVVFVNKDRDFFEIRGTYPKKSFHQCQRRNPGGYWSFSLVNNPETAFICEGSIDALSLHLLHLNNPSFDTKAAYCSIAGVGNQASILQIARQFPKVILAVDNDPAGNACRDRNPNLSSICPVMKDWNEDLLKRSCPSAQHWYVK